MKTPYCGRAMIGNVYADVDIANVDVAQWKGTATNVDASMHTPSEALLTLLEQPRPGWSARVQVTEDADGVVHLDGTGYFYGSRRQVDESETQSLWVRKLPRAT